MIIGLPSQNELPKYFDRYINLVFTDDLIAGLEEEMQEIMQRMFDFRALCYNIDE